MTSLLSRIKDGEDVEQELQEAIDNLYSHGPSDYGDIEVLSYVKLYQSNLFSRYEKTILNLMGLYFKNDLYDDGDLRGVVSSIFGQSIQEKYGHKYTPVQANLIENITDKRLFSFSSATSTGKSHVFRDLILNQAGDMVIVVPSRALINEYFTRTLKLVEGIRVNVLVFPDIVNTALADRNVFILTPERVKDLFRLKDRLNVKTVLFDEAQLADEEGRRGIYFDSIVRRINEHFKDASLLFAQPYIDNPEAQFVRNKLGDNSAQQHSVAYPYRNVGQVFICTDGKGRYYHFATNKNRLGQIKTAMNYDPIEKCLDNDGSVLVYVSKASIYNGAAFDEMDSYINRLSEITDENAIKLIDKIGDLLGGSADYEDPSHSDLLSLLGKGIVIHHGSLPLQARFLVEEFINGGYCKICFATSTLYQGINMPFDIVYLHRLDGSKPLLVKNLIGRAGRSTLDPVFDFGQVIVGLSGMSTLRKILANPEVMSEHSQIDIDNVDDDVDLAEFKEAVRNSQLDDTYNLTKSQIDRLSSENSAKNVATIIGILFPDNKSISEVYKSLDNNTRQYIIDSFKNIFKQHVKSRDLSEGESAVIDSAVRIFMTQVGGRNLKSIIEGRFAYIAKLTERRSLERIREVNPHFYNLKLRTMRPTLTMPAEDIPDKNLSFFGLFEPGTNIKNTRYDRVMYDTYDYIDKVWGFCLADIFYAAFDLYYANTSDNRARIMCTYIRYATIDDIEIWLLRYGFSFEEIEWIKPLVQSIDEERIKFKDISELNEDQLATINRYLPD